MGDAMQTGADSEAGRDTVQGGDGCGLDSGVGLDATQRRGAESSDSMGDAMQGGAVRGVDSGFGGDTTSDGAPLARRQGARAKVVQAVLPSDSNAADRPPKARIGVMGGTFDPIHNGHLVAASEVAWALNLDEVVFVPTGNPNFKQDRQVTPAEHRYLMTVIATASNPQFTVSRVDIDRPGVTYTVDTLRDLKAQYPDADLFFISGADAISQILSWHKADELWEYADFVAVGRPGSSMELAGIPAGEVTKVEIPALAISSTDCRRRASLGMPIWYLVPDGVVRYIDKFGLYQQRG